MSIINQLLNDLTRRNQHHFFKENNLFKNLRPALQQENFFAKYRLTFLLLLLLTMLLILIMVISHHEQKFVYKQLKITPLKQITLQSNINSPPLAILNDVKIESEKQQTVITLFFDQLPSYYIKSENTDDYQLIKIGLDIQQLPENFVFPHLEENTTFNAIDTSFKQNLYQIILNLKPQIQIKSLTTQQKAIKIVLLDPKTTQTIATTSEMQIQNHESNQTKSSLNPYEQALEINEQGHRKVATGILFRLLKDSPNHQLARQQLVHWLLEENQLSEAEKLIDDGLLLADKNSNLIKIKARLLIERQDYSHAIDILNQVTPNIRQDPDYYELKASILQQTHQTNLAVDTYRQLVQVMPENGNWWVGLAINLEENNQTNQAIQAYQQALNSELTKPELKAYANTRVQQLKG